MAGLLEARPKLPDTRRVSRVSFLACPVWLGRAQLSVRSGEVDETPVMLMAGLGCNEIRRGQRSAGARGWNRLDWRLRMDVRIESNAV